MIRRIPSFVKGQSYFILSHPVVCIFSVLQSRRRSPTLTGDFAFAIRHLAYQFTLTDNVSRWTLFLHGVCMLHECISTQKNFSV